MSIFRWSNFPELVEKEQSNLPSTGLIINGDVWVKHLCHVHNKSQTIQFWILEAVLLWKTICWCVQSHPEDRGDFEQGSTENISECNNHLELSVYNMGRAVGKGPLGHKIWKMSFHRHVIVQILKNFGVQTVFWNSTPKCPKRGIEKRHVLPKSCMRAAIWWLD